MKKVAVVGSESRRLGELRELGGAKLYKNG